MTKWHLFLALLSAGTLFACGSERQAAPQLIVAVDGDPEITLRVARIEARLFSPNGSEPLQPAQRFALHEGEGSRGARSVTLPFSFELREHRAGIARLELIGYPTWSADAPAILERKELVHIEPGRIQLVSVFLRTGCLDRAAWCATPELTCSAERGSTCVPVSDATLLPMPDAVGSVDGGMAADATWPDGLDASQPAEGGAATLRDADSTADAAAPGTDAAAAQEQEHDAGTIDAAPDANIEQLPVCPVVDACALPEYPCLRSDDGQGYSCRGQYAAWPMPDAQPDSKVKPSYTVMSAEGTVLDEVTGLSWQRDLPATYAGCTRQIATAPGDGCTWEEAKRYCAQLSLASKRWRLPSKIELESLLDTARPLGEAMIDTEAFPDAPAQGFWTATRVTYAPELVYELSFLVGAQLTPRTVEARRVRCVHSTRAPNAPPEQRYEVDADAARDRYTELEWRRDISDALATLDEARSFCSDLGEGFRVPTLKELFTLSDALSASPEPPVFEPLLPNVMLWSTTAAPSGGSFVYAPYLGQAATDQTVLANRPLFSVHARCVR